MTRSHHFLRDVMFLGIAFAVLFIVGLALESGVAAAAGLLGLILVAGVVPFVAVYLDRP
jgi:hypothetical protein